MLVLSCWLVALFCGLFCLLMVVRCWWFAVRFFLGGGLIAFFKKIGFLVRCDFCVVRCLSFGSLLFVRCCLCFVVFVVRCGLLFVIVLSFVVCCVLLVVCCFMFVVWRLLCIVCVVFVLSFVVHCLLVCLSFVGECCVVYGSFGSRPCIVVCFICVLFVVYYLCGVCCLFDDCRLWFVVCCLMFVCVVCGSLIGLRCGLYVACFMCCLLFVVRCIAYGVGYLLFVV